MFKKFLSLSVLLSAGMCLAQATQPADKLLATVKSPEAGAFEKMDALRQLQIVAKTEAIPVLAGLLTDEKYSHMARYAMETIADPAVDEALRAALPKVKGRLLAGVIGSLGVRRDDKAVGALAGLLSDNDPMVAQAAARALGSIGSPDAAKALEGAWAGAKAANKPALAEGLLRAGESLAAQNQKEASLAVYDKLRASDAPYQVRVGGLRGAILVRGEQGLALLMETLKTPDMALFAGAVAISMEMPGQAVTAALVEAARQAQAENKAVLLSAISKRKDMSALPALIEMAKQGDKTMRLAAIRAIGEIGQPSSAPVMIALLDDQDREISQQAQETLASLPGPDVDAAVLAMFGGSDTAKRLVAMDVMSRRRMTSSVSSLFKATGDPDPKIRPAAIRRLGEMAGPGDMPTMLDLFMKSKGEELGASEQAVLAICQREEKPESCAPRLVALMDKADMDHKGALLRVLSGIGGADALGAIRAVLKDGSTDKALRATAIRALGNWKTADAAPDLLALAQNAPDAKEKILGLRAYLSLAGRSDIVGEQRMAMCKQGAALAQRPEEKRLLLGALGNINTGAALNMILPYLEDSATKEEASAAAVNIGEKLIKSKNAKARANLAKPMEKVVAATGNPAMSKRAAAVLKEAKAAEGAK